MSKLELRPLQIATLDAIHEAFLQGHKNIMVQAPCGFGKTELATAILEKTNNNMKRGAFICDRISLVNQTSERFDKYGLSHGVLQGQHWRYRPYERIQVCSVQTLLKRDSWPDIVLQVIDEAHVLSAQIKKKLLEKSCYSIGLSATPVTKGLGRYFDVVINAATTNQLIKDNLLVPYRIFAPTEPNMEGVSVTSTGEWDEKQTAQRVMPIVGDCVVEYLKHGEGKKFIVFASSIDHAAELNRQFMAAGVMTSLYTYQESDTEREEAVREFRKPDSYIRGLISIEALTRGFDVADVGVLILARPLRNAFAVHIQMIGRVLRTFFGKSEALILDHSGNCVRFWDRMNDFFESGLSELDDGRRQEKSASKDEEQEEKSRKCPICHHLHAMAPTCPHCGYAYPKKENTVQHKAGTLVELIASGDRKTMDKQLWPQIVHYAASKYGWTTEGEKRALAIYKNMTGDWPKAKYADTLPIPITSEVKNKIIQKQIAWAKMQNKLKQPTQLRAV